MNKTTAIVIVTHNSAAEVDSCLRAIQEQVWNVASTSTEVVVVDNDSTDNTCEVVETRAPWAKLIRNNSNRGFAAAVNQGVRATRSPLVLLLNPDANLENGIQALAAAFDSAEVGAAGGKLVDSSGEWQRGFNIRSFPTPAAFAYEALLVNRVFPRNAVNRQYRQLDVDPTREQEVDQPAGAFLMFRRAIWEKLGGLDEAFYPLWFEDVDFCLRVKRAGYRILYIPNAVARHAGAHSIRSVSLQFRQVAWYGSFLQFCNKHFSAGTRRGLQAATAAGLCLRWGACCLGAGDRYERRAYGSALKRVMGSQAARDVTPNVARTSIVES